jgi:hypothetical protein
MREWGKAKTDYSRVLQVYPDYATAWYGLQDINQPYEELPMLDMDLVNDARK